MESDLLSGSTYTHHARKKLQQLLDCSERQQQIDIRDRAAGYLNESAALRSGVIKKKVSFKSSAAELQKKATSKKTNLTQPHVTPVLKPAFFYSASNYVNQLRNFSLQSSFEANITGPSDYVYVPPKTTVIALSKSEEHARLTKKVRDLASLWHPATDDQRVALPDEEFVRHLASRLVPSDRYAEMLVWRTKCFRLARQLHPVSMSDLLRDVLGNFDQILVYHLYEAAEIVLTDGMQQSQERLGQLTQRSQELLNPPDGSASQRHAKSTDSSVRPSSNEQAGSQRTSARYKRKLQDEMERYDALESQVDEELKIKTELKQTLHDLQMQFAELESQRNVLEVENKKILKDIKFVQKAIEVRRPQEPADLVNRLVSELASHLDEISLIEAEMLRSSAYLPLVDYENLVDTSISAEAQSQKLEFLQSTLSTKVRRYEADTEHFFHAYKDEISENDVAQLKRFINELPDETTPVFTNESESKWRWYIS